MKKIFSTKNLKFGLHSVNYLVRTNLFHKKIPFSGGMIVNEKCNLCCIQCRVANRKGIPDLTYKEIGNGLDLLYKKGIRSVFFEGGEPFLWRSGEYRLEDLIKLAKKKGFLWTSIYTNGTIPFESSADTVFVSIDGLKKTNNELRARGKNIYDKSMQNIKNSKHPNIIINFTINSINQYEIEEFYDEIKQIKQINGIFFNFHTPYYGIDKLFLDIDKKRKIIERIRTLKRKGYKIINSYPALDIIYKDNWKRPTDLCFIYANNKMHKCCRAIGNKTACKNCGYLHYPEIYGILNLKPNSLFSALNYLSS